MTCRLINQSIEVPRRARAVARAGPPWRSQKKELETSLLSLGIPVKNIKEKTLHSMTKKQWIIFLGLIILPGAILILIFSLLGRLIIQKLTKEKTSRTFGNIEITEEDIYEELYKD